MEPLPPRTFVDPIRPKKKKRKRKGLRHESPKRAKLNDAYRDIRVEFLREHPYCQYTIQENGLNESSVIANAGGETVYRDGKWRWISVPRSDQIHHKRGRIGHLLIDTSYFLAVCDEAHKAIHADPKKAYEKGYMLPR